MIVRTLHSPEQRAELEHSPALPPFNAANLAEHGADLHLCAICSGKVQAHASLWWTNVSACGNEKLGIIGHYASSGHEAGQTVLAAAIEQLRNQLCTMAIGPMDGSTWRSYRFIVDSGSESPFFLEPVNPPLWPLEWERAGFAPAAQYISTLNDDLSQIDPRVTGAATRLQFSGVRIRHAEPPALPKELSRIYEISRIAFANNFLYTELPRDAFLAQYAALIPQIHPELLLIAERNGEPVGFLFAIPDLAQAARGETIDTFLIKTLAILPDHSLGGLGAWMVAQVHETGRRLGFRRCIHALMHENNVSTNISRRYSKMIRRYALFGRRIDA